MARKTASFGRIVFGLSAVLYGSIALMWRDPETWQALSKMWSLPSGTVIGECLMIAQIAGGLCLLYPRTVRLASIILGTVYLLFSLACIPGIVAAPTDFGQYDGFFEQFCLLCGAIAAYAATDSSRARTAALGRMARIGLGLCVISFTLAQIVYLHDTVGLVPKWIPPNQIFWAIFTTIAFALAALAILTNRQARLAIRLMSLMVGLFGVLVWIPILIAHPKSHFSWSEFALTFLISGAAWMVGILKFF